MKLVVFDLDGTLYRGSEAVPFAAECVSHLRERGIAVRFLTNNSGTVPALMAAKLSGLGLEAHEDECWSTAVAAQRVCARFRSVFVIGEPVLCDLFPPADDNPDAVLCGICRTFSYAHIDRALQAILGGAAFFATNRDPTYPLEGNRFQPGAGSMVGAIEACTGVRPQVLGKPEPLILRWILEEAGVLPEECLVVGDRLDTDIAAATAAGCDSWLVLTGATRELPAGQAGSVDLSGLIEWIV